MSENFSATVSTHSRLLTTTIISIIGLAASPGTDVLETITVPGIKELPLTLECRIVYKQKQDPQSIQPEYNDMFYPQDVDGTYHDRNRDYHTAYYGEIVNAYIIK